MGGISNIGGLEKELIDNMGKIDYKKRAEELENCVDYFIDTYMACGDCYDCPFYGDGLCDLIETKTALDTYEYLNGDSINIKKDGYTETCAKLKDMLLQKSKEIKNKGSKD